MFNLPESTNIRKNIYKKVIYDRFLDELNGNKRKRFDQDISRITIINEISESSIDVSRTEEISAIFVVKIDLKSKDYLDSNIILISKLFGQNLLLVLHYKNEYRLAIFETKLIVSDWKKENQIILNIEGDNLESVWKNLVTQVGDIDIEEGNTLEEQIEIDIKKEKLIKLIDKTEKRARKERQAKKKFELFKEIEKYQKELEDL